MHFVYGDSPATVINVEHDRMRIYFWDGVHTPYLIGPFNPSGDDEADDGSPMALVGNDRFLCFRYSQRDLPQGAEFIVYDLQTHAWNISDINPGTGGTYGMGMFPVFDRYFLFQGYDTNRVWGWYYWDT